ncbi:MAG: hypothetical protein B6242_10010 [Anaerolineaceae bacterium 4572_78]|nr:MAG: hypothetical protein B6242_10010 [Anaerolineaceae bacterium 4572_78]
MLMVTLPKQLEKQFQQMAQTIYPQGHSENVLIEAIELWLEIKRKEQTEIERCLNNQTFEIMQAELNKKYHGKWIAIAHGKLVWVGDTLEELSNIAPSAYHRLIMQIGQTYPEKVELGWQTTFI